METEWEGLGMGPDLDTDGGCPSMRERQRRSPSLEWIGGGGKGGERGRIETRKIGESRNGDTGCVDH